MHYLGEYYQYNYCYLPGLTYYLLYISTVALPVIACSCRSTNCVIKYQIPRNFACTAGLGHSQMFQSDWA